MNLYFDDNIADQKLRALLVKQAHTVVQPSDVGLRGASDARHLEYAARHRLVLMTKDNDDFEDLHLLVRTCGGSHPGILLIRSDNDPTRDMKPKQITAALAKMANALTDCTNQLIVLNHWR
jgi:predicted nuclease of predicted toxin-antitoxin system